MKEGHTISIAIATYNGERFLREQLDSLYRQTRQPDEVVVSDDGSTDGTIAILKEYKQKYGLRYEQNPGRKGVTGNFEHALRMSAGDYICLCDQDDIWLEGKVETLYRAIRDTDSNIPVAVSSSRIDIDAKGREIGRAKIETTGSRWQDNLLHTGCSQGCTMILNRCLVNKMLEMYDTNPKAYGYLHDTLASCTAALLGEKRNLPDRLMLYRHHDCNVMDPLRNGRYTFWQKVHDMPTYYPFLLDYRIHELAQTDELFAEEAVPEDIRVFLHRMTELDHVKNIWKGLVIICQLPEISWSRKCKTLLLTPIARTLKIIQNAYRQHTARK